jgi:hypothetical protein
VIGKEGQLINREEVVGGKKCRATESGTTMVTIFKYKGSEEETISTQEIEKPLWACTEFIRKTCPPRIEKP